MSATALQVVDENYRRNPRRKQKVNEKRIRGLLQQFRTRVLRLNFSVIKKEDLNGFVVVERKGDYFIFIPERKKEEVLSHIPCMEVPIRFSAMRSAGMTLDFVFSNRLNDAFTVVYCWQEVSTVVSANWLFEHMGD